MLIQSIDHIREIIPVNAGADFETFKPYVKAVESQVFIPLLGQPLYNELNALTDDTMNDDQYVLMEKIRYSLVNLTMFKGFDMLNVTYDDSGFERVSKDTALYRYQEENLKSSFKNEGFNGIDTVLEFLQVNLPKYKKFNDSEFYIEMKENFFSTTSQFNRIYAIGNSRLVFIQLCKYMNQVIDFKIKPTIGNTLFSKVLAEMKKESGQNPDLISLVPYIRRPLAFFMAHEGLNELGLQVTDKGIFFEMAKEGSGNHIEAQTDDGRLGLMLHKAENNGIRYQEMLLDYLKANADKYPDFTQSDIENTNSFKRDNSNKKTFFA